MPTFPIRVEQKHIDSGERAHCGQCPIALALTEALGVPCRVDHYCWFAIESGIPVNRAWTAWLPKIAQQFVEDFDAKHYVGPFSFEVEWRPGVGMTTTHE